MEDDKQRKPKGVAAGGEGDKPTVPAAPLPEDEAGVPSRLDQAWKLLEEGEFVQARVVAHGLLDITPDSWEVYTLLGAIAWTEDKTDEAITHFEQAMELDEKAIDPLLYLIDLRTETGSAEEAIRLCDRGLELADTDDERATFTLRKFEAIFDEGHGDIEAAREVLRTLPEGPYENAETSFVAGCAFLRAEEAASAEAHLLNAAKINIENPEVWRHLACARAMMGDTKGAARDRLACLGLLEHQLKGTLDPVALEAVAKRIIQELPDPAGSILRQALMTVRDLPGAELVAEGLDPRTCCIIDGLGDFAGTGSAEVFLVFIYTENVAVALACEGSKDRSLVEFLTEMLTEELAVSALTETIKRTAEPNPPTDK